MDDLSTDDLDRAVRAIHDGNLVVYPTETVYGLGADALDAAAVDRVFATKGRDRSDPISMAVPDVDAATEYVRLDDRERRFAEEFLPGPVTLVCERRSVVPDALTAGRDRVGVRVPDHKVASSLLERVDPVTATSANLTGAGGVRRVRDLDSGVQDVVAVVLDGGETPGGGSTVVDVAAGTIYRRGLLAEEVETWLDDHPTVR
jgi:L-threonylcarbamoyladenylate synthase